MQKITDVATNSLVIIKDKNKKSFINEEIKPILYGHLGHKELENIKLASKADSVIKPHNVIYINRLNDGKITLSDLGIVEIKDIEKKFTKSECAKITKLDLRNFEVKDADIKMISDLFPNLILLSMDITTLNHCTQLKTLILGFRNKDIMNWKEFEKKFPSLPMLENLTLYGCKAKDFSFFKKLSSLVTLDLTYVKHPGFLKKEDFSQSKHLENVILAMSEIDNLKAFKQCTSIKNLDLFECKSLISIESLPSSLETLNLSDCQNMTDFSRIKECTSLKKINLTKCIFIGLGFLTDFKGLYLTVTDFDDKVKYLEEDDIIIPYEWPKVVRPIEKTR